MLRLLSASARSQGASAFSSGSFGLSATKSFSVTSRQAANPLDFISATIDEATKKKKDDTVTETKDDKTKESEASKIRPGATAKFASDKAKAIFYKTRGSLWKFQPILDSLRYLPYDEAVQQTYLSKNKIYIVPVRKAVKSAAANAQHNFGLSQNRLILDEVYGTKGVYRPGLRYHGRGRSGRMSKPSTHLTAVVREVPLPKEGETEVKLSTRAKESRRHIINAFRDQWDRIARLRRVAFAEGKDPWAADVVPAESSSFQPKFTRHVPFHGNSPSSSSL